MCGIVGYKSFFSNSNNKDYLEHAIAKLANRGPDNKGSCFQNNVGLGHTRLSIIDTSNMGNQPMIDPSGRYALVFNGEIYNYLNLKKGLSVIEWQSSSDTEVLLHLLIKEGPKCLKKLNGFFSFAFYDNQEDYLLIARDRMGIKPLHYYQDKNSLIFASEIKALQTFPIPKVLDHQSLYWYLKLNYLPGNLSMLNGIRKLLPGHYLEIHKDKVEAKAFWKLDKESSFKGNYHNSQNQLVDLLETSVKDRLMADVPLGAFLSGGTDSSAIVSLASRHHNNLSTFSIGYKNHPYFDETHYAELVANKFKTNHTTFSLSNDDLLVDLANIIDYIDEPFADSSAIPTYILSKHVGKHIKVALSGDGADELFGGYYKHMALNQSLTSSFSNELIRRLNPALNLLPQSRSGKFSNIIRRIDRFANMLNMPDNERYWYLASLTNDPSFLLKTPIDDNSISSFKEYYFQENPDLNDYLDTDLKIVLPGDMLTKVDLMSMANSLEVRVPFLDHRVVSFARSLPSSFKVKGNHRKRILQDAFKNILPTELYNRPKKGFEVPLLDWMRNELSQDLDQKLFNREMLISQGIFNETSVLNLKQKLHSRNPGDVHGIIWALYIFQKWYKGIF